MAFTGAFTLVLAKHSKHFSPQDTLATAVDRMQRNFEPMGVKWSSGAINSCPRR